MPQVVASARKALPHIDIILKEMVSIEQIQGLEANTIDLGFTRSLPIRGNLTREQVASEKMVVALPIEHPLAAKQTISWQDLHGQPFITYTPKTGNYFYTIITRLLNELGIVPEYVQHVDESHTILGLVRAGLGISIVPESVSVLYTDKVVFRPIGRNELRADTCMIWRSDCCNPALVTFRDFASKHFARFRLPS
ncbi:LysR substrate binding domain-containing protein [Propionivibrio dicarboxylicus]|uniref:LysR substrate binding domain-containing protein n=2 Tax=Propionivibrio dicarboxylicus TaxID=83767 RepID=A0A1G8IZU3_9RHOO|nr:LysR substrate binding domain-containing protein [Propionivibrio dicarboxylicus]